MIIRSTRELDRRYHDLGPGDMVVGLLPPKYLKGAGCIDLLQRGVGCLPSVLSQHLSRSKAAQAWLFARWMAPHTRVISRRVELLEAIGDFARQGIGPVVTKQEGRHCGHGIRRWESVETVYNTLAFDDAAYPFVLQPCLTGCIDLRAVLVGDYAEAYARENPFNFRANLAAGGKSAPRVLDEPLLRFCRAVMARGRFPYAHVDLLLAADGRCYLSEIALDGGITGARIGREELNRRKRDELERLACHSPERTPASPRGGWVSGMEED